MGTVRYRPRVNTIQKKSAVDKAAGRWFPAGLDFIALCYRKVVGILWGFEKTVSA
jgi:hypothetical protein